ncbi:hypothetical protein SLE2022_371600 [Rubroshorea leprosula]
MAFSLPIKDNLISRDIGLTQIPFCAICPEETEQLNHVTAPCVTSGCTFVFGGLLLCVPRFCIEPRPSTCFWFGF